ncbi:MAG: insulinase family protein [Ignavibacteria bacterium]|nr:insulinase family protein [Ignavibacteria bacterium]
MKKDYSSLRAASGLSKPGSILFAEGTLENGLRVILSQDTTIPSAAVNLCYHVGSKDESPGMRGYAHLFEHLMFEGSVNLEPGEYDSLSIEAGCENNAYTTEDKTNYYLLAPSNQLEFGLWLESDRMLGFAVTEESLEVQKGVVIEEKKQVFDNRPYGSVNLEFPPRLFKNNGYSWDTIGDTGDIEKAKLSDVKGFYEKYYIPGNAVLAIAGDIDIENTFKLVEKYFGPIKSGNVIPPRSFNDSPLPAEEIVTVKDDIQLPGVFIGYKIPEENSKEYYSFDILTDILSSGDSSRMYRSLVYDKQLVSDTGCWVEGREFSGVFYFYAILMPGVKLPDVQDEFDRILSDIIINGPAERELEKVKNRIETRNTYRMQTNLSKADMLAHYKTFYNDAGLVNSTVERYMEVKREDIMNAAKSYLNKNNRVILNYVPR